MFIYNIKINKNKALKLILFLFIFLSIFILFISIYNLFLNKNFKITDEISANFISEINSDQYTNILKEVYENLDDYIGQQINFTGYIYRLSNFQDNQFVLARNMIISSDFQNVVVGFLCSYENANLFKDGTWVNITGTIVNGNYYDEIPIIEVTKIEETSKPENEFVYPPSENYIPTSIIF